MSKKIRLTALALAVLMVVPMIFAGCSKDGRTPADTTPAVMTASDNLPTTGTPTTTGNTAPATETTPAPATEAPPEPAPEPPVQSLTIAGTALDAFSVCIQPDAGETAAYAAEELCRYLKLAAGAALPVVPPEAAAAPCIRIGRAETAPDGSALGVDDYAVCVESGDLMLLGGGGRGVLYAVYNFLEETVGCRWYASDTEVILPAESIDMPEGTRRIEHAVFEYRDSFWTDVIQHPELCVRLKANTDSGKPIPTEMGGHIGYNGFVHTLTSRYCSADRYFREHPEYFALHFGKRTRNQLCLTNPDVLKIVTEEVLDAIAENNARIVSVSQHDNQDFCTCDNCRAIDEAEGSHMGTMLRFVNAVADAVAEQYPDVMVDTLAYQYTRNVPKLTRPRDNVIIRLCSIECCFRHALTDESCRENTLFKKDIEDWNEICDRLYIWDYVTDFSHYLMPFPNFDSMYENARFFADHHVKGIFEEGNYTSVSGEFGELRGYLLAKLLWDPYMDESAYRRHMREFCEGYYGPGGDHVMEILDLLQETTADRDVGCFAKPKEVLPEFAQHLDRIDALWDAVEAKAQTDLERSHIERSRLSTDYIALTFRSSEWFCGGKEDILREKSESFYGRLNRYGIKLSEGE